MKNEKGQGVNWGEIGERNGGSRAMESNGE